VLVHYKADVIINSLNITCSRHDIAENCSFGKTTSVKYKITTLIDKTTPVKYKITMWTDTTTPVEYKITIQIE
jgi:hypothetical protein